MFSYLYGPLFEDLANQNLGVRFGPQIWGSNLSSPSFFQLVTPKARGPFWTPVSVPKLQKLSSMWTNVLGPKTDVLTHFCYSVFFRFLNPIVCAHVLPLMVFRL